MSTSGQAGRAITLATPKIKLNGVEYDNANGHLTTANTGGNPSNVEVSSIVDYLYPRTHGGQGLPVDVTSGPVTVTFTTTDTGVDLYYTFNGRTPRPTPSSAFPTNDTTGPATPPSKPLQSGKYDVSNPPVLYQNTCGQNTVIKVRAFKQHANLTVQENTNNVSLIARGMIKIHGTADGQNT